MTDLKDSRSVGDAIAKEMMEARILFQSDYETAKRIIDSALPTVQEKGEKWEALHRNGETWLNKMDSGMWRQVLAAVEDPGKDLFGILKILEEEHNACVGNADHEGEKKDSDATPSAQNVMPLGQSYEETGEPLGPSWKAGQVFRATSDKFGTCDLLCVRCPGQGRENRCRAVPLRPPDGKQIGGALYHSSFGRDVVVCSWPDLPSYYAAQSAPQTPSLATEPQATSVPSQDAVPVFPNPLENCCTQHTDAERSKVRTSCIVCLFNKAYPSSPATPSTHPEFQAITESPSTPSKPPATGEKEKP